MKRKVMLLLPIAISACLVLYIQRQPIWSDETPQIQDITQESYIVAEEEKTAMNNQNAVNQLVDILGCSERTAQSLCNKVEMAISERVVEIENVPNDSYRVLKVTSDSGNVFFAKVMSGYFLSKIYADSLEGELVYKAIQ